MTKNNARQRTTADKFISGFNEARYLMVEPVLLRLARLRYERFYIKPDNNPLISVYAPTYNRAEILMERAVKSVLAQTYKNFEFIIVGDHCADKTEEMVLKIDDPRIRFYNLPRRGYRYPPTAENHWLAGPVTAANQGLKMVKGKWIARLDDDDIWTKNHLEELLKFAQAGNYEFVSACHIIKEQGHNKVISGTEAQSPYYNVKNRPVRGANPKIGGSCTWFYRSYLKFIKYNINCWRKSWNRVNDAELSMRVFKAGVRLGFLEKPLAWYLPRPGETLTGVAAYLNAAEDKQKHFEFKD